mmetsp:Transcript_2667/g.10565  ORF Transcript_2667/g.10565 Transcript_2667/m.10565 type:complete len:370 (+) Transcript_2667:1281-2390(+)
MDRGPGDRQRGARGIDSAAATRAQAGAGFRSRRRGRVHRRRAPRVPSRDAPGPHDGRVRDVSRGDLLGRGLLGNVRRLSPGTRRETTGRLGVRGVRAGNRRRDGGRVRLRSVPSGDVFRVRGGIQLRAVRAVRTRDVRVSKRHSRLRRVPPRNVPKRLRGDGVCFVSFVDVFAKQKSRLERSVLALSRRVVFKHRGRRGVRFVRAGVHRAGAGHDRVRALCDWFVRRGRERPEVRAVSGGNLRRFGQRVERRNRMSSVRRGELFLGARRGEVRSLSPGFLQHFGGLGGVRAVPPRLLRQVRGHEQPKRGVLRVRTRPSQPHLRRRRDGDRRRLGRRRGFDRRRLERRRRELRERKRQRDGRRRKLFRRQ